MGIAVEVTVPSNPLSLPARFGERITRLEPEPVAPLRRQFLLTMFVADRPGLLEEFLRALDDGIAAKDVAEGAGGSETVAFSLDGSLATVLHHTGTVTVVVHPVWRTTGLSVEPDQLSDAVIVARLGEQLRSIFGPRAIPPIVPLPTRDLRIFDRNRRFAEYRFGCDRPHGHKLGLAARRFSGVLGAARFPIAYLMFPDRWRAASYTKDWLRVGIGYADAVDGVRIDAMATQIAAELGCEVQRHDPSIEHADMSSQFRRLSIATESDHVDAAGKAPSPNEIDVVFVSDVAEPGLVAGWLKDAPTEILGGSMTVLAGRTVATWVLPGGTGPGFIKRVADGESREEPLITRLIDGLSVPSPSTRDSKHLWVAWRCQDRSGVLSTLLSAVKGAIADQPCSLVVDYETSRVLEVGQTCAGKLRLLVDDCHDSVVSRVRKAVEKAIVPFVAEWHPEVEDWHDNPVVVSDHEPSADPWARLAAVTGDSDTYLETLRRAGLPALSPAHS